MTFYPDTQNCTLCGGDLVLRKAVSYKKYIVKYYKQEKDKSDL